MQAQLGNGKMEKNGLDSVFSTYQRVLPEVTLRLSDWLAKVPIQIAPRVWDATIAMADRMAFWVEKRWEILTEADLDSYTFSVAGSVGLLICDIWAWFDGSQIDREAAIQLGRGLQSVNILRNRAEDVSRGVDFYPRGWSDSDMFAYAHRHIEKAKTSILTIPASSFRIMVDIPLALAEATLRVLEEGRSKLTRREVLKIVGQA
jgi:farnesyl-diphosphate farnesyltransferase